MDLALDYISILFALLQYLMSTRNVCCAEDQDMSNWRYGHTRVEERADRFPLEIQTAPSKLPRSVNGGFVELIVIN